MKKINYIALLPGFLLFAQCDEPDTNQKQFNTAETDTTTTTAPQPQRQQVQAYTALTNNFRFITAKDSIRHIGKYFDAGQQNLLLALNRTDYEHITKLDTLIVPDNFEGDLIQHSPYPQNVPYLKDIHKIIYFSYPAEYFAAYEYGQLVRSGQTNMGRQKDPTPTGIFYTNWKAEETKSTFNDEWDLKWNFNIQNKEGVGFHQYALPGYPASHSCLRLTEGDARFLYEWADEWVIKGTDNILAKGTPVIVFGTYPFGKGKPWLQLAKDPKAMDITADALQQQTSGYLTDIMAQQKKREALKAK